MSRPCPLCGDTLDVEWKIRDDGAEMKFSCPACEGSGIIIAHIGDVTPINEEED